MFPIWGRPRPRAPAHRHRTRPRMRAFCVESDTSCRARAFLWVRHHDPPVYIVVIENLLRVNRGDRSVRGGELRADRTVAMLWWPHLGQGRCRLRMPPFLEDLLMAVSLVRPGAAFSHAEPHFYCVSKSARRPLPRTERLSRKPPPTSSGRCRWRCLKTHFPALSPRRAWMDQD